MSVILTNATKHKGGKKYTSAFDKKKLTYSSVKRETNNKTGRKQSQEDRLDGADVRFKKKKKN